MATEILKNIQEEVTCPICLELLSEPLSLDCGHSFCQTCITANSQEVSPPEKNSCPVCRTIYEPGNMRPNRHLANVASRLREVKLSPEMEEKKDLCAHHGEKLLLFCKEDWMFICWLCERSQEHRDHHTFLIEEVAKECQEKLQLSLEILRKKQQKAEVYETALREQKTSWKNQIEIEIQSVKKEFKKMRDIIDMKELKELQKLRQEEENIFHNLEKSEKELIQQKKLLQDLILDMEHTRQASMKEMLLNVNDIIKRSKTLTLREPKFFPLGKLKVFQAPDLGRILQELNELKDVQRYWVQMDLKDPGNNPGIAISSNGREAKRVSYQNISCNSCNNYVLGSQAINSGKYYWEVDVSEKQEWMVGVLQITPQKRPFQFRIQLHPFLLLQEDNFFGYSQPKYSNPSKSQHVCPIYEPKFGYWVIGLQNSMYKVFVDSSTSNPGFLALSMTVPPCRIGVFVNYEARIVSFYNVSQHGFLIYQFISCCFTHEIVPYFNLKNCFVPMKLCSPNS